MPSQRISKKLVNFKKNIFYYRDGYYELPYISSSPEIMVDSLQSMPFTKHHVAEKAIYSDNDFIDGVLRYRKLENGFWLMATEIEFKKNICTKTLYDVEPSNYYFLSYFNYSISKKNVLVNNVSMPTKGWSLYKPGTAVNSYFNKGDKCIALNFVFDTEWLTKNMHTHKWADENSIKQYLLSDKQFIVWADIVPITNASAQEIIASMKGEEDDDYRNISLKIFSLNMLLLFFKGIAALDAKKAASSIKELDKKHLAKAEKMLLQTLTTQFPSIEAISKAVHISPTKLKMLFKLVYGKTLFQYYQEKQMQLALELLKNEDASVKKVSISLGYENASNFIVAFKKYHHFLPSEVNN